MIKRLLLTASLTISSAFAYNVGDTVDKSIVNCPVSPRYGCLNLQV